MGEEVEQQEFSRADRTQYREKVRRNLDVFARMLREPAAKEALTSFMEKRHPDFSKY